MTNAYETIQKTKLKSARRGHHTHEPYRRSLEEVTGSMSTYSTTSYPYGGKP